MNCPKCGYEWTPNVPDPKECPSCKTRLHEFVRQKKAREQKAQIDETSRDPEVREYVRILETECAMYHKDAIARVKELLEAGMLPLALELMKVVSGSEDLSLPEVNRAALETKADQLRAEMKQFEGS